MKLFHGTTADNLPDIRTNGLRADKGGENWTVSGEAVYFWSPDALLECGEAEDMEGAIERAKQMATDSASFGLGFSKDCRVIVLEIELEDGTEDVAPDESCDNMEGAVCTTNDVPFSAVRKIHATQDLSLLKGYFLTFALDRKMSARELSPMEKKIAKIFSKAEIYPEEDGFMELSELTE